MGSGINASGHVNIVVDVINATYKKHLKEKIMFLVILKLMKHQILKCLHVPQNMVPLILNNNIYIFLLIKTA